MSTFVSVVISGLVSGALYIGIALGLVVTSRFVGVLNFAQGAIGTLAAYLTYDLMLHSWSLAAAAPVAIVCGALVALIEGWAVSTFLVGASELTVTMTTLGPALVIVGLVGVLWGQDPEAINAPSVLQGSVSLLGTHVGSLGLAIGFAVLIVVGLISAVLRWTRIGLALRAMGDDPAVAAINGINVARLERAVWLASGAIGAAAGIAITTTADLDPNFLTNFMIEAFTAVVLGGVASITGLVGGGLVYGVFLAGASYFWGDSYTAVFSFGLLAVLFYLRPEGIFGHRTQRVSRLRVPRNARRATWLSSRSLGARGPRIPKLGSAGPLAAIPRKRIRSRVSHWYVRAAAAVIGLVVLLVGAKFFSSAWIFAFATVWATAIAVSGQNVVAGVSGQFSMAQGGLMLFGAYLGVLLSVHAHISSALAVLLVIPVGGVIGMLLSFGVARAAGVYLAILTLQLTLALPEIALGQESLTHGAFGLAAPPLGIAGHKYESSYSLYLASAVIGVIILAALFALGRSRYSNRFRAVRDSPAGAEAIGIEPRWPRVAAMSVSAAAGTAAGALSAFQVGTVTADMFGVYTSINILLAASIGGQESLVVGPLFGAAFIVLLPFGLNTSGGISSVIFGGAAFFVLLGRVTVTRIRVRNAQDRRAALHNEHSDTKIPGEFVEAV